jgi:tetratricopeptide (TPR) repeat protein
MATCQFALEDFPRAHTNLEEALSLSGYNTETVLDYRQLAEILNNLGCLSYMGGKPDKAKILFRESLQAQANARDDSLYTGTQFSCHSGESELDGLKIRIFSTFPSEKPRKSALYKCNVHRDCLLSRMMS